MICEGCGKREAFLEYRDVIKGLDGEAKVLRLCFRCSKALGLLPRYILKGGMKMKRDFRSRRGSLSCPRCGLRKAEILKFGILGCPDCYEVFRDILIPMIREYHGYVEHVGKRASRPPEASFLRRRAKRLKEALERAVSREAYWEAARIRDEIRRIEALYGTMGEDTI